jgi:hypothetical protein
VSGVDLVQWLREQLDEDERIARAAADGGSGEWFVGDKWNVYRVEDQTPFEDDETNALVVYGNVKPQSEHIAAHDPARVLRDIDRDRRILIRCQEEMLSGIPRLVHFAKQTVRELALSYEGRPGYAEALAAFE